MSTRRRPVFDPSDVALFYAAQTEAALQRRLQTLCAAFGLPHYHTHRSTRSEAGFPDSTIIRPPEAWGKPWVVFVELKAERGKPSPAQTAWGAALRAAEAASGGAVAYRLVRPSTWDRLVALLEEGRR